MAPLGFCLPLILLTTFVLQKSCADQPETRVTPQFQSFLNGFLAGFEADQTAAAVPGAQAGPESLWGTGICDSGCTCGLPNRENRIIGGTPTNVNEYPWVVALVKNRKIFCGGTLITNLHVMTAAHCVAGNLFMARRQITVVLAEHDISTSDESPMATRRVSSIIRHKEFRPFYGSTTFENDIALIRMSSPVSFSAELSPACLPSPGNDFDGYQGIITGWGRTEEKGRPSRELLAAVIKIYSREECTKKTSYTTNQVTVDMICAGRLEGGVDSCQGDSGGGLLVIDSYNRMVAAGIVSWGEGCARKHRPGVYTRVNHYLKWIQANTKDACFCS